MTASLSTTSMQGSCVSYRIARGRKAFVCRVQESARSSTGSRRTTSARAREADMTFTSLVVIAPHVEAGKLRILGVSGAQRMPQIPNVPTIAEGGLSGYEHEQWYGLFAPAKTPAG